MKEELDTPAVLIDMDIVKENIQAYQKYCNGIGINLRPHIKTHKIPELAKLQLNEGAVGITCQKISEAEAIISEGGISDILITYNIIGQKKLMALKKLSKRANISVVADSMYCLEGLSRAFEDSKKKLRVLVECDTGANRCGVISPSAALKLAKVISSNNNLIFGGLMTYPPISEPEKVNSFLAEAKDLIEKNGIKVETISIGGSPDMWKVKKIPIANEYRIGTYIFNDRSLLHNGVCKERDCALTVLATVVSTPTDYRAIVDAGSKVLTSDLFGLEDYGRVRSKPHLKICQLTEEHGTIISDNPTGLKIGQQLKIIPNHACVVTNMLDSVIFVANEMPIKHQKVIARGKVW